MRVLVVSYEGEMRCMNTTPIGIGYYINVNIVCRNYKIWRELYEA